MRKKEGHHYFQIKSSHSLHKNGTELVQTPNLNFPYSVFDYAFPPLSLSLPPLGRRKKNHFLQNEKVGSSINTPNTENEIGSCTISPCSSSSEEHQKKEKKNRIRKKQQKPLSLFSIIIVQLFRFNGQVKEQC